MSVPHGLNRGLEMLVDPRAELGYLRGDHEPWIQDLLADWLPPGAVFLDVGSHVGFFTMAASRLLGCDRTVIAVEPDSETFSPDRSRSRVMVDEPADCAVGAVAS